MVTRNRTQLTDTGSPYVRSARLDDAWLRLRLRREAFSYPVNTHVRATIETEGHSETALHEQVRFETEEKTQVVLFEFGTTTTLTIEPVVPLPDSKTPPSRDFTEAPATLDVAISIFDTSTDREYDDVTVRLERDSDGYQVVGIDD